MSRLEQLFNHKKANILNIYATAGFPYLDSTLSIMQALQNAGADIIELGMPYSDPIADGEVIQKSSDEALKNGMTIDLLFKQLENCREKIHIPIVLMGYLNPVLQYGFEQFCAKAATVGVDGFIIPDLPPYELEHTYKPILKKYNLDFICLVTPETPMERVKMLDQLSSGFLYAVSSSSTTGKKKDFSQIQNYLQSLASYQLKNPVLVGFGIRDKESFQAVCQYAQGGIIGSAYIKSLQSSPDNIEQTTAHFLASIKG